MTTFPNMVYLFVLCVLTSVVDGRTGSIRLGQFANVCKKCRYDLGGGYVPYPGDCEKYVQCMQHQKNYTVKTCPSGLHWDTVSEACNYPSAAKCTHRQCYHCDEHWIRHGSSCYLFIGTKRTWVEASHVCEGRGAALAAVESSDESAFIRGYLKVFAHLKADIPTWIGGTDMEIEEVWKWSPSGRKFTYTDWYPGQPDPNGGDCLIIWPNHAYHWGDIGCSYQASFICEKPYVYRTD